MIQYKCPIDNIVYYLCIDKHTGKALQIFRVDEKTGEFLVRKAWQVLNMPVYLYDGNWQKHKSAIGNFYELAKSPMNSHLTFNVISTLEAECFVL